MNVSVPRVVLVLLGLGGALWVGCTDRVSEPVSGEIPSPIRRLRRLSSREYNNAVRDLLGDTTRPADRFITDVYTNGYDNGSSGLAVQSDQIVDYQWAAESLAAAAVERHLGSLVGNCDPLQVETCVDRLLAGFGARAFRRDLTATERGRFQILFRRISAPPGSFVEGIRAVLEAILLSPEFLYREELGPTGAAAVSGGEVRLTPDEVATELSFLITGSIPDAALQQAIQGGRFSTSDDYTREARRLFGAPGAHQAMGHFLHEWLGTDWLDSLSKSATVYPAFNASLASSMRAELDLFYEDSLWNGSGSLRNLFTSTRGFADANLAPIYGAGALDPQLRQGVMTRAGFLAIHADADSSGPIVRGVFLLQSIFCAPPPNPPANIPPAPAPSDPSVKNLTTRQRFANHVSNAACAACHTRIDGIGFGFEEFDGLGRSRTTDNGHPVDASGTVGGTNEIDGPYNGIADLTQRLAGSQTLARCYQRQAYRYAMGQIEPAGSVEAVARSYSTDQPAIDALLRLIADPSFDHRTVE